MRKVILASASPRRQRLMKWLGLPFDVVVSNVNEDVGTTHGVGAAKLAREWALDKARDVGARDGAEALVLGFDTLVLSDGEIFGKPQGADDARRTLEALSGRVHTVVTGVALVDGNDAKTKSLVHETTVRMKTLSETGIERWLAGDEALACAGAYNIERHLAAVEPDQCFQNVAGLPLCHVYLLLIRYFGLAPIRPDGPCNAARGVRCGMAAALLGRDRLEEPGERGELGLSIE